MVQLLSNATCRCAIVMYVMDSKNSGTIRGAGDSVTALMLSHLAPLARVYIHKLRGSDIDVRSSGVHSICVSFKQASYLKLS